MGMSIAVLVPLFIIPASSPVPKPPLSLTLSHHLPVRPLLPYHPTLVPSLISSWKTTSSKAVTLIALELGHVAGAGGSEQSLSLPPAQWNSVLAAPGAHDQPLLGAPDRCWASVSPLRASSPPGSVPPCCQELSVWTLHDPSLRQPGRWRGLPEHVHVSVLRAVAGCLWQKGHVA